jgi:hypothetical protein
MTQQRLARIQWRALCDRVSKAAANQSAELEIVSLDIGDRVEARWLPLYGLSFDARADVLEIALAGIDHLIEHPVDLRIEETPRGLVAIEITRADGTEEVLQLRNPLPLPQEPPTGDALP